MVDLKRINKKWQKKWEEKGIFKTKESKGKKKFYVLDMFPYPSGAGLHIGHAFVFSLGDIFARFKRMQGFNVFYPIGYDSLGLPAENAAIEAGTHPEDYTKKSIANFMKQQKAMGWSYDWERMIKTSNPSYYKWDQWIFLKMLEKGIAYRKKAPVNWCPRLGGSAGDMKAQKLKSNI
jgi:leucyl-tRNA synthetase